MLMIDIVLYGENSEFGIDIDVENHSIIFSEKNSEHQNLIHVVTNSKLL